MKPECERVVPLILRAADGTLAPGERAALDAHAASCPDCRETLGDQAAVSRLLAAELELPAASRAFAARVRARVEPGAGIFDLLNWRAWTLRLAPLAALLALAAWLPFATTTSDTPARQTLPAIVDEWAGAEAQVAGGALGIGADASAVDRDALLAVALGEASE